MNASEWITLGVGAFVVYFTYRLVAVTKTMADATSRSISASVQPLLVSARPSTDLRVEPGVTIFEFEIRNIGKGPAVVTRAQLIWERSSIEAWTARPRIVPTDESIFVSFLDSSGGDTLVAALESDDCYISVSYSDAADGNRLASKFRLAVSSDALMVSRTDLYRNGESEPFATTEPRSSWEG